MSENAAQFGTWLATESVKLFGERDTLSICVLGARTPTEVSDLLTPLSRKLNSGVTTWARGLFEKTQPLPSPKIRYKIQADGAWDVVLFSPYFTEVNSPKSIRGDVIYALTVAKRSENARVLLCVSRNAEVAPMALRARLFGHSPPATEEFKGSTCEEDLCQVLEDLGFAQITVGRLNCTVDLTGISKNASTALNELSYWLRVPLDFCKKVDQSQLRRLFERGTETIMQPKAVFIVPIPPGFEREARAQPSMKDWWPTGDFKTFRHNGVESWSNTRKSWLSTPPPDGSKNKLVKLPKLTSRDLNALVETLTTNHDKIELPGPMRLDDLLDVLVDVWDSVDDNA